MTEQTIIDATGHEFIPDSVKVPSWYEDDDVTVPWSIAQHYPDDVWWEEIEHDLEEE